MTYVEGVGEYCDVQLREVLQSWVDAMVPDPDPKKLMKMDPTYKKKQIMGKREKINFINILFFH